MKPRTKILIIAGSDSSGGAGIQADIKTVTALGGYAMTAVTAITAQNTTGVASIVAIPPKEIAKQILFTAKDIKPDAIKIGMLHSREVIKEVLSSLKKIKNNRVVLDPVMVAKGGAKLINDQAVYALRDKLIKEVFLITPNIPEAEVLIGKKIRNLDEMILAAYRLIHLGANNVLIKGGDQQGAAFVSSTDEFEQHRGLGLVFGDVGEVVEDDQIEAIKAMDGRLQGKFAAGDLQSLNQLRGSCKEHLPALLDQAQADGGGQVRLASTGWADQDQIGAVAKPGIAGA